MSTWKPMLAKDGDPSALIYPLLLQPKLDGIRALIVDGKLVSRTKKPIQNAEIREALERPEFEGLDGELLVGDPTAEGCMQRTSSFVMAPNKTGEPWAFYAFDKHDDPGPFKDRINAVRRIVIDTTWTSIPIFAVDTWHVSTPEDVEDHEVRLLDAGHEGVILRDPAGLYKFGRSGVKGPLIKVKRFVDFEATVVGVYEELHNGNEATRDAYGRTERSSVKANKTGKGTLGGLVLVTLPPSDRDNPQLPEAGIEFRCGTGFTAEHRASLWQLAHMLDEVPDRFEGLNGRTAKIKSFPVGVKDKPRHPVFLGWRDVEAGG